VIFHKSPWTNAPPMEQFWIITGSIIISGKISKVLVNRTPS
jgi:hypothetical protein